MEGDTMSIEGFTRKLTAILSADVKGYSRLMGDDEAATVRTITAYRDIMSKLIQHHHGRVVDSPGDNILAEFASVVDAVQCAVEIQQVLKSRNAQLPEERRMEFRIGINLGDVIEEEGRLYGDGINIAARIEALADPGGICVSGTVYEHIKNKLTLWEEYLGEHTVKNIVDPVKVYRIRLEPEAAVEEDRAKRFSLKRWQWGALVAVVALVVGVGGYMIWNNTLRPSPTPTEVAPEETSVIEVSEKPSIAVLPFDNMSGDPQQEYFSDGITEDLITDLSKISELFVISRNSTFVYKGVAVNIEEVSQELGVRYVLEGSVRKDNGTVRITAQLIDASTGGHLWAERYDRDLVDIFSVQDEVVEKIVAALEVELTDEEQDRLDQNQTDNLDAYDFAKRGWWLKGQLTREDNDQARLMFEQAIDLDPQFADAYVGLGFTYYEAWSHQWTQDPQSLNQAYDLAVQAIALDERQAGAYALLGWVHLWRKEFDLAISHKEQAIALNPNEADHYVDLAQVLIFSGDPEEAIKWVEEAMLLNPHYPVHYPFALGFAYLMLERYEESIAAQEEALSINPFNLASYLNLVGAYVGLGQIEQAQYYMGEALKINPHLSLSTSRERFPFKDPEVLEWVLDAFQKAGLE
jgi:adenylate cyclase